MAFIFGTKNYRNHTAKRQHFCFQRPLKQCRPLLTTLKNFGAQTKALLFTTTLCILLIEIIWELF